MLRNRDERTWAWSGGGPGRNSGEHSALKSIFGTVVQSRSPGGQWSGHLPRLKRGELPMKPWFGRARSGGAISRVIPHTTEVLPSLTRAEDGAVETEPARRAINTHHHTECPGLGCGGIDAPVFTLTSLEAWSSLRGLPSGRRFSSRKRSRYGRGNRRLNSAGVKLVEAAGVSAVAAAISRWIILARV